MSTKMYNLYRVEDKDIHALFSWLVETRKRYHERIQEEMKPFVQKLSKEKIIDLMERAIRPGMNDLFNIEASAAVYSNEGNLYVQFFGLPFRFQDEEVEKASFLTDFHYQNQADQPEDIPDEEWDTRRRIVNAILDIDPAAARPSRCGLIFSFADITDAFDLMH